MRYVLIATLSIAIALTPGFSGCGGEGDGLTQQASVSPEPPRLCLPLGDGSQRGIEGEVTDGPFEFRLTLLEDPVFKPPAEAWHPYAMTSIPNVGWSYECAYSGPDMGQTIVQGALFLNGEIVQGDLGTDYNDTLRYGAACGKRSGGILLPREPDDGDRVGLGARTIVGDETYGAVMTFTVVAKDGALIACDPSFATWPDR